jgi:hypothetical protein
MRPEDLRKYVRWNNDFQPIRIQLKDGRSFDIRHPNHALVAEAIVIVARPPADEPDSIYGDGSEWVRYDQIDSVEMLPASVSLYHG